MHEPVRKVLVVGSGGREHALALKLLESPSVSEVIVAPGGILGELGAPTPNAAIGSAAVGKKLSSSKDAPLELAKREQVDLVVVGPEVPLCDGLVDVLTREGVLTYGPSKAAAELEGSKAFMKAFCVRHGVPTARHVVVQDAAQLEGLVRSFEVAPVVKADGLCAGKGVVVAESHEEALAAAREMLSGARFGDAGATVVLEERLLGNEASIHAICDGERYVLLHAAQDHKRIFDGDRGPNTGGMGTYAPAPVVTPAVMQEFEERVVRPTLRGMASEGRPFRGTLFAGVMVTPDEHVKLIEFNVRFGDPETQVLMATLEGNLAEVLASAARGELDPASLRASGEHAVCIVLAAHGYPDTPRKGDVIRGLEPAAAVPGVSVLHAGTARDAQGNVVTAGGRVLGVTGRGATLKEAHGRAYQAARLIEFDGMQYRRDIAGRAGLSL
ncbi:MAG TPA: phosphoribosylamine--glycine ligase [Polyangiaceae bacterium]|nr:phosphoribosylamine--glycine ligase [Polyangiaceae bacterium]